MVQAGGLAAEDTPGTADTANGSKEPDEIGTKSPSSHQ